MARTKHTAIDASPFHRVTEAEVFQKTITNVVQSVRSLSSAGALLPPVKKCKIDGNKVEQNKKSVSLLDLNNDEIVAIISFALYDRVTGFCLELICKRFAALFHIPSESTSEANIWTILIREWDIVIPQKGTPMSAVLDMTFHNMFRNEFEKLIESELSSNQYDKPVDYSDYGPWCWDKYGKRPDMLPEFQKICWKEFFYLAYHNQRELCDKDLERCPQIYSVMKSNDVSSHMFSSGILSWSPNIEFDQDGNFKTQDAFLTSEPFNPAVDEEGQQIEVTVLGTTHKVTQFLFSRQYTVFNMARKIDWDSIDVVYAYRNHNTGPDIFDKKGGLIARLKDGKYIRLLANVFSAYTDYLCGAMWLCDSFVPLISINEREPNIR